MFTVKIKYLFVCILIIIAFSNCSNSETSKLIDSSISTGNLLSEYYGSLIKSSIESWELEAFNSSLREIDFPKEIQDEYKITIKHLESRKALVDSFVKILPLLKEFTEDKMPEEFKKASIELGNNISELKPLKDNKIVIPSEIFGNLSEDIIQLYKYIEIRSIAKILVRALEKIKILFVKESHLYASIIEEKNIKSQTVINYLIDNELVIPWALIESVPGSIGLELSVAKKPAKDPKTKLALKKILEVKYYRFNYLIESAGNDLNILLEDLIKTYNEYIKGNKIVLDNILYITNRIEIYFNDINKYKDTITGK